MSSKEQRDLRLEILRERYHNKHAPGFQDTLVQIEKNPTVQDRIHKYLSYKKSSLDNGKRDSSES